MEETQVKREKSLEKPQAGIIASDRLFGLMSQGTISHILANTQ